MLEIEASMTAKVCAFTRAYHSKFIENKVYDDYLAYEMLGEKEFETMKKQIDQMVKENPFYPPHIKTWDAFLDEMVSPIILSRIKYAETGLRKYVEENGEIQYVSCGAGLDTFAFRNTDERIHIFEVDHPNTHHYKRKRIRQLGWKIPKNVHYISVDFEKENMIEGLLKAGFRTEKKTFFAMLGVTYYLELEAIEQVLHTMSKLTGEESVIVLDYPDRDLLSLDQERAKRLMEITGRFGEEMKTGINRHELTHALKQCDYDLMESLDAKEIQRDLLGSHAIRAYHNINFIMAKNKRA